MRAIARRKKAANASFMIGAAQSSLIFAGTIPLLPLLGSVDFGDFKEYSWWFIGGGLAAALGNACIYKLFSYLDAGISSILSTTWVFFAIVFAALILDERLNSQQALGAAVLLGSIVYGTWIARHREIKKKNAQAWLLGLFFATLAGVLVGGGIVNEKYLLDNVNVSTFLFFAFAAQVCFSIFIAFLVQRKKVGILFDRAILKLNFYNAATRVASGLFIVLALVKSNNVALTTVSSNFRIILVVLLGAILLKEHQRLPQKLTAALVASVGLVIIFWE